MHIRGIFQLEVNFKHLVETLKQDKERKTLDLVLRIGNSDRLAVHYLSNHNSFCFDTSFTAVI